MNISEMHVWFRQYAQQMGIQNVRAILPEQIDLLINTSITDIVNQLITQSIGVTNDRVITDNSKLGQINALRSIYKVITVNAVPILDESHTSVTSPFSKDDLLQPVYKIRASINNFDTDFAYLYLVDLAITYSDITVYDKPPKICTNYFPVRLIDDMYLADTLNDFILRPRLRTPIAVIHDNTLNLYIDYQIPTPSLTELNNLPENLCPYKLRVSYLAKPATVAYKSDIGGTNVDCDLPEYLHVDILKHAVDLYRISVSGALSNAQQQAQQQQQETTRNNYRNDNAQQ